VSVCVCVFVCQQIKLSHSFVISIVLSNLNGIFGGNRFGVDGCDDDGQGFDSVYYSDASPANVTCAGLGCVLTITRQTVQVCRKDYSEQSTSITRATSLFRCRVTLENEERI
jgi:hypothetical protein